MSERLKLKLTGLWQQSHETGDGTVQYLSGTISPSLRLLVWPNGFKKKGNDPDWIAYLVPNAAGATATAEEAASPAPPRAPTGDTHELDRRL